MLISRFCRIKQKKKSLILHEPGFVLSNKLLGIKSEGCETLNIEMDNGQTKYKVRTLTHNLQQLIQEVRILFK